MAPSTHYVIVVHGTFAAPVAGQRQWHELDESDAANFCRRLNDRLEQAGLARPIERACRGTTIRFSWSGANDHPARVDAGKALHQLMTRLMAQDRSARIHLVAHSHGGNVVLKALELYLADIVNAACGWYWSGLDTGPAREAQLDEAMERHDTRSLPHDQALEALLADGEINQIGRVVCLGTPFYGKRWRARSWGPVRLALRFLVNAVPAAALLYTGLVLLYGGGLFGKGIEWVKSLFGGTAAAAPLPNLDVLSWSERSLWSFAAAAAVLAALAVWAEAKRQRRDIGNVYFDESALANLFVSLGLAAPRLNRPPFEALVMSLGLRDEALLALSTEPLVYGLLAPRIKAMFRRREAMTSEPLGEDRGDIGGVLAEFSGWLRRTVWAVTALPRRLVLRGTAVFYRPAVDLVTGAAESFVLRVIASAAFGVPPQEFSGSRIVVKPAIDVPAYFTEHACDVTPFLTGARASVPAAASASASAGASADPSGWAGSRDADPSASAGSRSVDPSASAGSRSVDPSTWAGFRNADPAAIDDDSAADLDRYAFLADDRRLEEAAARSALCGELERSQPQLAARYRGYADVGESASLPQLRRVSVMVERRLGEVVMGFGHVRYYALPQVVDAIAQFIATGREPR